MTNYDKKKLQRLAASCRLYVRIAGRRVTRPSSLRFHRDGRITAYVFAEQGRKSWIDVTGCEAWTDGESWKLNGKKDEKARSS